MVSSRPCVMQSRARCGSDETKARWIRPSVYKRKGGREGLREEG